VGHAGDAKLFASPHCRRVLLERYAQAQFDLAISKGHVLCLQRVVDGLATIIGYGDAAEIGQQTQSWIAGIQIKQLLIGVVVSSEARSAGADVSKAQRLIGTDLTLHL
jgi:hypothetical protein